MAARGDTRRNRAETPRRGFLSGWSGFITLVLGLIFFGIGAALLIDAKRFTDAATRTEGEVVKLIHDNGGDGVSYSPVIEYSDARGRRHQGVTHVSSSSYNYRKGERVRILFAPSYPGEVRIDTTFSLYGPGLIFGGVGLLILIIHAIAKLRAGRPAYRHRDAIPEAMDASRTTDPSVYGHVHEPKPQQEPTVRRMR